MDESAHDEAQPYTLARAAELTGLSVDALRKRVERKTLRASRSNEPPAGVRVWLTSRDVDRMASGRDQLAEYSEGEVTALREALERERERANQAESRAEREHERTAQAEQARARAEGREEQARTLADQRAAELAEIRERVGRAEGEAKALREALTETRRPGWRRWMGL